MMPLADWSRSRPDFNTFRDGCAATNCATSIANARAEGDGLTSDLMDNLCVSERHHQARLSEARARVWVGETEEVMAAQIGEAVERIEKYFLTQLSEVLLPFIDAKIEAAVVNEFCSEISKLAGHQLNEEISCSAPPHLRDNISEACEKLLHKPVTVTPFGPEIELRVGDTSICSQIAEWKNKLRQALTS
jgi:hypothetical protein